MDRFAREDVLEVFRRFGVRNARRAEPADSTEEIFVVPPRTYERIDVDALTRALMEVLPHTKVLVAPRKGGWEGEPL